MRALLTIGLYLLLTACNESGTEATTVSNTRHMLHDIPAFTPDSFINVVVEIPAGSNQKWEVNKTSGQIEWEQVTPDSFRVINYLPYPANYGFVPQTILPVASGGDGDPADVFILGPSIPRETISRVRIIGIIHALDTDEMDSKLLAVEVDTPYLDIYTLDELINHYPGAIDLITIWLSNYKGSDRIKIISINDEREAVRFLEKAHLEYLEHK